MKRFTYMSESLLDKVEADEVRDSELSTDEHDRKDARVVPLAVEFLQQWISRVSTPEAVFSQVRSAAEWFMRSDGGSASRKPEVKQGYRFKDSSADAKLIFIDGISVDGCIRKFCDLFVRMIFPRTMPEDSSSIRYKISVRVNNEESPAVVVSYTDDGTGKVRILSMEGWDDFISYMFPGTDKEAARTEIVRSFARLVADNATLVVKIDNSDYAYARRGHGLITRFKFSECGSFSDGCAKVGIAGAPQESRYNFIDENGNVMFDKGFYNADDFSDGVARVFDYAAGKYVFIDKSGNTVLVPDGYAPEQFSEGFAVIRYENSRHETFGYNYIDKSGTVLSPERLDRAQAFREGFGVVQRESGMCNYIDGKGNFLLEPGFQRCYKFSGGFGIVRDDGLFNYVGRNGRLLSDRWFANASDFRDGFGIVETGSSDAKTFIGADGKLIDCLTDRNGTRIRLDYVRDFSLKTGQIRCAITDAKPFSGGFAAVFITAADDSMRQFNGWNFIDKNGRLLSETFFEDAMPFVDGFAQVKTFCFDDHQAVIKMNYIDTQGRLVEPVGFSDKNQYVPIGNGTLLTDYGNGPAVDPDGEFIALI